VLVVLVEECSLELLSGESLSEVEDDLCLVIVVGATTAGTTTIGAGATTTGAGYTATGGGACDVVVVSLVVLSVV
jgi:hypothetical protein